MLLVQPLRIAGVKVQFEHEFDRIDGPVQRIAIPDETSRRIVVLDRRDAATDTSAEIRRGAGHVVPILVEGTGDRAGVVKDGVGEVADAEDLSLAPLAERIAGRDSPLWLPACDLISAEDGRTLILDESFEPYFSELQSLEIAAMTGEAVAGDLAACRAEARRRFAAAVLAFTPEEAEAVRWFVGQIREVCREQYGLLADAPWRFLKVHGDLCAGFPHTRATYIVTSERFLSRIVAARQETREKALSTVGRTFVHEQIHVLERLLPARFANLAETVMGFRRGQVVANAWVTERQMGNPDALDLGWLLPVKSADGTERVVWPRTLLKSDRPVPRMGADFWPVAVDVERRGDVWQVVEADGEPRLHPLAEFREPLEAMLAPPGIDHPNEVAAYVFERIFVEDCIPAPNRTADPRLAPYRAWFREHLR